MKLFQPHIHTDHRGDTYIGFQPSELAEAVALSGLDALAITPQIKLEEDIIEIRNLIAEACDRVGKEAVRVFPGVEAQLKEQGLAHHVGILFPEEALQRDSLPSQPHRRMTLESLDAYINSYPGSVAILCHPLWRKPDDQDRRDAYLRLASSGVFHGVEVSNYKHPHDTGACVELFLEARSKVSKLAMLGGSDASMPEHLMKVVTTYEGNDPLEAIRKGETAFRS